MAPDAAHFLDLMYVGDECVELEIQGQARYGLLLNENGIVVDDGHRGRALGPELYWVNTTQLRGSKRTAAAIRRMAAMRIQRQLRRAGDAPFTLTFGAM